MMQDLYKVLPDSFPFSFPTFDLIRCQGLNRGSTLSPVEDQELFDETCRQLGLTTYYRTLPHPAASPGVSF